MRIVYLDTALDDLKAVKAYFEENFPTHALSMWDGLIDRLERHITKILTMIPYSGNECADYPYRRKKYRYVPDGGKNKKYIQSDIDSFTLYHKVNEEKGVIEITRFLHSTAEVAYDLSEED